MTKPNGNEKYFSSGEVAKLLDLPRRTVAHYLKTNVLPGIQHPISGTWKISYPDLLTFLRERKLDSSILGQAPSVLVVDDEPEVLKIVERSLAKSSLRFSSVTGTTNGYEAMIKLGAMVPDLVILDVQMPGMDGRQVLSAIRQDERTRYLKVLAITGYPEFLDEMLALGADGALSKPIKAPALIEKVREIMGISEEAMLSA